MKLVWNNALPWPLIALIGVLIGAALFFSYRKPRRDIPAPTRRGLFALRLGVLLILLFLLGRPALEGHSSTSEENRMTILVTDRRHDGPRRSNPDGGASRRVEPLAGRAEGSRRDLPDLDAAVRVGGPRGQDLSFRPNDDRTGSSTRSDVVGGPARAAGAHRGDLGQPGNGGRDPQGRRKRSAEGSDPHGVDGQAGRRERDARVRAVGPRSQKS
jgi:hypothetical protein